MRFDFHFPWLCGPLVRPAPGNLKINYSKSITYNTRRAILRGLLLKLYLVEFQIVTTFFIFFYFKLWIISKFLYVWFPVKKIRSKTHSIFGSKESAFHSFPSRKQFFINWKWKNGDKKLSFKKRWIGSISACRNIHMIKFFSRWQKLLKADILSQRPPLLDILDIVLLYENGSPARLKGRISKLL